MKKPHPLIRDLKTEFAALAQKYAQPPRLTVRIVVEPHLPEIEECRDERVPDEVIAQLLEEIYNIPISVASLRAAISWAIKKREEEQANLPAQPPAASNPPEVISGDSALDPPARPLQLGADDDDIPF